MTVHPITPSRPQPTTDFGGSGNGGGDGRLTEHRLTELERRMSALEEKADSIRDSCTRIETKLDGMASKTFVLTIFGLTGGGLLISLIGHLLIRSIGAE